MGALVNVLYSRRNNCSYLLHKSKNNSILPNLFKNKNFNFVQNISQVHISEG